MLSLPVLILKAVGITSLPSSSPEPTTSGSTPQSYNPHVSSSNGSSHTSITSSPPEQPASSPVTPSSTSVITTTVVTTITVSGGICAVPTQTLLGLTSGWSSVQTNASSPPSASNCVLPNTPLTNEQQVGDSIWGTLCQPSFPKWLNGSHNLPYQSAPWGNATTKNTDATIINSTPNTNVTRYYDLTVSRSRISTDGVLRDVILINNQFPGPAIEANWGDWLEVTVHNNIAEPFEGTAMHWHGMLQRNTPWQDGVPGIGQCPIAPGHSFTYKFQAELFGTSWYHAHYSAQYTAGISGPMIIYGPASAQYDIDVGPVLLGDWHHVPYFSIVSDVIGTDLSVIPPTSDSALINGRGTFNCSHPSYSNNTEWLASNLKSNITWTCVENAEKSKFRLQKGKTHRLRLVNHGGDGIHKFSIDGHKLTVISTDYVPVVPYETEVITLGVGQRTDVLVTADKDSTSSFWMRTEIVGGPLCGGSTNPEGLAAVYYEDADTSQWPTTSGQTNSTSGSGCQNDALTTYQPDYPIAPTENPHTQDLVLALQVNSTGHGEWAINKQPYRANFNVPILNLAATGNVSYPDDPQWNVYNFNQNNSVVLNVTNTTPFPHPFHLHGHNFFILNEGPGAWTGATINPSSPMRRDTQIIQGSGYAVIQVELDNPGVWPFHCHVAWHLSGGMSINIMTRAQDIPQAAGLVAQTCTDWEHYTAQNVVDQIDSGS